MKLLIDAAHYLDIRLAHLRLIIVIPLDPAAVPIFGFLK